MYLPKLCCALTENISRTKAQSATRFVKAFFAALREKYFRSGSAENRPLRRTLNCGVIGLHLKNFATGFFNILTFCALEQAETQNQPIPFAPFGTVKNPIRMMMMEHDTAGDILRKLRAATADYQVPSDGCISYQTLYQALEEFEKDLHQHIHLENNVLFPKAAELESR